MSDHGIGPKGPANSHWVDGRTFHPLYQRWAQMVARCTNPNDPNWENYGGRGITVCDEWRHDFFAYVEALGPMPEPGLTVDRIDNNGNYESGNVRWATRAEQAQNKRKYRRTPTCRKGHPYTPENTYHYKNGKRGCRACGRAFAAKYREAKRERTSV